MRLAAKKDFNNLIPSTWMKEWNQQMEDELKAKQRDNEIKMIVYIKHV